MRFLPQPIDWSLISTKQCRMLESPFTEEEIWLAVEALGSNKSLGPDGCTTDILKPDIFRVFQDFFFQNDIINSNVNETYNCLISKNIDARKVGHYRPISLTTGLYKIIARVLSNRLKKVASTIMDYQSAFVEGRRIPDSSLIANEIIEEWHKRKIQEVVIKFDVEKVFDSRLGLPRQKDEN